MAKRSGGVASWGISGELGAMDPHDPTWWSSVPPWADLVYQSLAMLDERGSVVPCLAASWKLEEPSRWRFMLRPGVRFHDGSEVTAADVAASFRRVMDLERRSQQSQWSTIVERVEPVERLAVRFWLLEPYAPFLSSLAALRRTAIVPQTLAESSNLSRDAIGTGPFRVVEHARASHLRLSRHGGYWEHSLPRLEQVSIEATIPHPAVDGARSSACSGSSVPLRDAAGLVTVDGTKAVSSQGATLRAHHLNLRRKPFDDIRIRQAISMAVDRRSAIDRVAGGRAKLTGPIPAGHGAWSIQSDALPYRRDVGRARQRLAEAGLSEELKTVITSLDGGPELELSRLLSAQLDEIGVDAEVRPLDAESLRGAALDRDFDIISSTIHFLPDPHAYLGEAYRDGSQGNVTGLPSARLDDLLDRARTNMDPNQRRPLYDEAQAVILDESPSIWWYAEDQIDVIRPSLVGYSQVYSGRLTGLKAARVEG